MVTRTGGAAAAAGDTSPNSTLTRLTPRVPPPRPTLEADPPCLLLTRSGPVAQGPAEDVGLQRGPLRALDGTLLPEDVAAEWEVGDGETSQGERWNDPESEEGWLPSPGLRCEGVQWLPGHEPPEKREEANARQHAEKAAAEANAVEARAAAERAAEVRAAEVRAAEVAAARALLREEIEGLRRWTEDADNNVTRVLSSLQILVQPDGSVKRLKE